MLFVYLYHGDLYPDLWKSDPYLRPAEFFSDARQLEVSLFLF